MSRLERGLQLSSRGRARPYNWFAPAGPGAQRLREDARERGAYERAARRSGRKQARDRRCVARLKRMFLHCVDAEDEMRKLGVSSKLNAQWDFLMWLHELGRGRAGAFLEAHYDKLGRESSVDIGARFL